MTNTKRTTVPVLYDRHGEPTRRGLMVIAAVIDGEVANNGTPCIEMRRSRSGAWLEWDGGWAVNPPSPKCPHTVKAWKLAVGSQYVHEPSTGYGPETDAENDKWAEDFRQAYAEMVSR